MRDWILRWARLKAVISLPQETFAPYGAGVKTSVVFLQKREKPLPAPKQATAQLDLLAAAEEAQETAEEDYDVYMARIDSIGYDATGRLSVPEDEAPEPPEVKETIADFAQRSGW